MLRRERGFALLESLLASATLALAVLGMLVVQIRTQADMQASVRRMQAVRLIEDFAERIRTHPDGLHPPAAYASGWHAVPLSPDCETDACDPTALLKWDQAAWKRAIADALPLGQARVFETGNDGELGVMVGWRASQDAPVGEAWARAPGHGNQGTLPSTDCPVGFLCHLGHVRL